MGCDIHAYGEKQTPDGYEMIESFFPFNYRNYGLYGFLANVRNYSAVKPISELRGLPACSAGVKKEYDEWDSDAHSSSWLSLDELERFNYDDDMEDRRVTRNNDGGCTCDAGDGKKTTYREFLGDRYFEELAKLKELGANRIVFWFDN